MIYASFEHSSFIGRGWMLDVEQLQSAGYYEADDCWPLFERDFIHYVDRACDQYPLFLGVRVSELSAAQGEAIALSESRECVEVPSELMEIARTVFGISAPPAYFLVSQMS